MPPRGGPLMNADAIDSIADERRAAEHYGTEPQARIAIKKHP